MSRARPCFALLLRMMKCMQGSPLHQGGRRDRPGTVISWPRAPPLLDEHAHVLHLSQPEFASFFIARGNSMSPRANIRCSSAKSEPGRAFCPQSKAKTARKDQEVDAASRGGALASSPLSTFAESFAPSVGSRRRWNKPGHARRSVRDPAAPRTGPLPFVRLPLGGGGGADKTRARPRARCGTHPSTAISLKLKLKSNDTIPCH